MLIYRYVACKNCKKKVHLAGVVALYFCFEALHSRYLTVNLDREGCSCFSFLVSCRSTGRLDAAMVIVYTVSLVLGTQA